MALSHTIKNGEPYYKISFTNKKGKSDTIYIGYDAKEARYHALFIETLIELSLQSNPIYGDNIIDYLSEIKKENPSLYSKLEKKGLVVKTEGDKIEETNQSKLSLGRLIDMFLEYTHDVADSTMRISINAFNHLLEYFDRDILIEDIDEEQIKLFQKWLYGRYAEATASRFSKKYRQLFNWGIKRKLVTENIFRELDVRSMVNEERQQYVPSETVQKLIDSCVTDELRFALYLARWCSFRIPSEVNKLRWSQFDFGEKVFIVTGKKDKKRKVPIFDDNRCDMYPFISELLSFRKCKSFLNDIENLSVSEIKLLLQKKGDKYFIEMSQRFSKDQDFVFSPDFRKRSCRSCQMEKLKKKAGVKFKKDFQNLRASSETDMVRYYGIDAAVKWTGNSKKVALEHYLQVPDEIWQAAKGKDAEPEKEDQARQFLTDKELIKVLLKRYKLKRLQEMIIEAVNER